uniref:Uncharacterized protein n=1 Tax=Arundo donax TaxID=35708 RepID=A0A0A9BMI2_ARUDO
MYQYGHNYIRLCITLEKTLLKHMREEREASNISRKHGMDQIHITQQLTIS